VETRAFASACALPQRGAGLVVVLRERRERRRACPGCPTGEAVSRILYATPSRVGVCSALIVRCATRLKYSWRRERRRALIPPPRRPGVIEEDDVQVGVVVELRAAEFAEADPPTEAVRRRTGPAARPSLAHAVHRDADGGVERDLGDDRELLADDVAAGSP
jgi:hypothetical protein